MHPVCVCARAAAPWLSDLLRHRLVGPVLSAACDAPPLASITVSNGCVWLFPHLLHSRCQPPHGTPAPPDSVRTSEREIASARTVNSLPHLDFAAGNADASDDLVGPQARMPVLGDVTCMALVRLDEMQPLKDLVLTGSSDGWVHCWSHVL
jgi:hypothetical protein